MERLSIACRPVRVYENLRGSIFRPFASVNRQRQHQRARFEPGPACRGNLQHRQLFSTAKRLSSKNKLQEAPSDAKADTVGRHCTWPKTTTTQAATSMASDNDYMAFLNKANGEADEARAKGSKETTGTSRAQLKTMDDNGEQAPQAIVDVCKTAVYASDADEPFEQVSLRWKGQDGLPDEDEFAKLIKHWDVAKAEISILDPLDWDANGQYTDVIEAVRQASRGNDVRVYKMVRDETRVEYWVITRDGDRIVGAKALAIES